LAYSPDTLFVVASAGSEVPHKETEEIYLIARGLYLTYSLAPSREKN